jgi:hypothetical protein
MCRPRDEDDGVWMGRDLNLREDIGCRDPMARIKVTTEDDDEGY